MNEDTPEQPSTFRNMMDFILGNNLYKKKRAQYPEFFDYIESPDCLGVRIELPTALLLEKRSVLTEATRAEVGGFTARRDPPHFAGDTYHGHCDVGRGYEVSWSVSGARRHLSKFPAQVPHDAKIAVAKVLNVSADILEAFWIDEDGARFLLLETGGAA
jgi:hypothetical protein